MATGITKGERANGRDALTATHLRRGMHAEDIADVPLVFDYPGKMPRADVLALPRPRWRLHSDGCFAMAAGPIAPNGLLLGDNLGAMLSLLDGLRGEIQLIYLDPPFQTGMEFHTRGLDHAYKDLMSPTAYLEFMRRRLIVMHELLAPTGSLYLHIGHQMLFHLKVLLDEVFGASGFRNLIVRRKCSSKNYTRNQYPNLHDYLLFYTKNKRYKWHLPEVQPTDDWIDREYPMVTPEGRRYKLVPVHAPGIRYGDTGRTWRGREPPPGKHWQLTPARLDELDRRGEIHWSGNGNPRRIVFLPDEKLVPRTDYWSDMRDAHHQSVRITGYPTEKNLSMLECIVESGTDPGDIVLDPFCGSGTTLQAARDTRRRWIGIDESVTALRASLSRLVDGAKPMGDYVSADRKRAPLQQELLFDKPDLDPNGVDAAFSLLVDDDFFPDHEELLRELASGL